jgi:hypothetical protein
MSTAFNRFEERFKGELVVYAKKTDGYWNITGGGVTFFEKFRTLTEARNHLREKVK